MMRGKCVLSKVVLVSLILVGGVSHAGRTLLSVREDTSSADANTRTWLYEHELSDPYTTEDAFTYTSRVFEKGTNINYISGYSPEGNPLWSPTVTDFVETTGDYAWKVETGAAKVYVVHGGGDGALAPL